MSALEQLKQELGVVSSDELIALARSTAEDTLERELEGFKTNVSKVMESLEAQKGQVKTIEVKQLDREPVKIDLAHQKFEELLTVAPYRYPILWGPSGSGKSYACKQLAEALSLEFYFQSVNRFSQPHDFLGYTDANGNYVTTPLRQAWENGGVYLLDEVDRASESSMVALNAICEYSTTHMFFPDGKVARHKDFHLVASANTNLNGESMHYNSAQAQDMSFVTRFYMLKWDYDSRLERALAGQHPSIYAYVLGLREAIKDLRLNVIVTPRHTETGALFKELGADSEIVRNSIVGHIDESSLEAIMNHRSMSDVKRLIDG